MREIDIARVCHEVNRAYCESLGDTSQVAWDEAPDWQKTSLMNGVVAKIQNPDMTPEESHQSWYDEKEQAGWRYGVMKNAETKEHPCMVQYDHMPTDLRSKDHLFGAIVTSLSRFLEATDAGSNAD